MGNMLDSRPDKDWLAWVSIPVGSINLIKVLFLIFPVNTRYH